MLGYTVLALLLALALPLGTTAETPAPALHTRAAEKKALNGDTVGWLQVPGTDIDEVVLFKADDFNNYYYRRDFDKKYSFDGCYYADFRCVFDSGKLSRNTVIYGHSFEDDADSRRFGQLRRYRDADFAAENPYIYFATTGETMKWQVFAVSIMTIDIPYNLPELPDKEYTQVLDLLRKNSLREYGDIEVGAGDRILTLSTTDYSAGVYPNDNRFVIAAKLVEDDGKTA